VIGASISVTNCVLYAAQRLYDLVVSCEVHCSDIYTLGRLLIRVHEALRMLHLRQIDRIRVR